MQDLFLQKIYDKLVLEKGSAENASISEHPRAYLQTEIDNKNTTTTTAPTKTTTDQQQQQTAA